MCPLPRFSKWIRQIGTKQNARATGESTIIQSGRDTILDSKGHGTDALELSLHGFTDIRNYVFFIGNKRKETDVFDLDLVIKNTSNKTVFDITCHIRISDYLYRKYFERNYDTSPIIGEVRSESFERDGELFVDVYYNIEKLNPGISFNLGDVIFSSFKSNVDKRVKWESSDGIPVSAMVHVTLGWPVEISLTARDFPHLHTKKSFEFYKSFKGKFDWYLRSSFVPKRLKGDSKKLLDYCFLIPKDRLEWEFGKEFEELLGKQFDQEKMEKHVQYIKELSPDTSNEEAQKQVSHAIGRKFQHVKVTPVRLRMSGSEKSGSSYRPLADFE